MAKSSLEKAIEKQQREDKKRAEREARRQRAAAIVSGQPTIGGMRIMDAAAEEILQIVISQYDGNESRNVRGNYNVIPEAYHSSLRLEFEKLSMYGVISSPQILIYGDWEVTLTPQGFTYFEDKEKAQQKEEDQVSQNMKNRADRKEYDVFISHATKDKMSYVNELFFALRKLGVQIFYDSEEISWGDKWKQAILEGTEKSEFAIIVISKNFFGREWTERELSEFFQRQNSSQQKIVLPLLYNITREDVLAQYPFLEEIQYISSEDYSIEEICILFAKELIKRLKG